ncbi:arsenate reductase [Psychromonas ingrahamii 37]|uniref:Arsenate reductase n=1 Tax=Psychromonas ingrahamii (strain DSM 17664 / CCUG 51855 / 37) TaxID=357804 RepID=A1STU7_PSYIN|nr:arsenate reductase (glutaredoxin) [Psychromonas ingrahamii]ABM02912.1 arsenate reductase [Psychromonas ingrahamii 37]
MTGIIIYHNPICSKSRTTLALLKEHSDNDNIKVIKYLETPPTVEQLQDIINRLDFDSARQLMRCNEDLYKTLKLKDQNNEQLLLQAMVENPKLIERPIVLANGKAIIGRPPESVLTIL